MSAAHSRAELAAIGCDLLALDGEPDARRGAALLRRITGRGPTGGSLDELKGAPAWLRATSDRQRRLAHAVALSALAQKLAGSIDGAWLGGLAEVAGDDLLDWAIDHADSLPGCDVPEVAPARLATLGFGLLQSLLAPGLWAYLPESETAFSGLCSPRLVETYLLAALPIVPLR